MKIRTEEKSAILEQDILEYEKYIEELKREKSEETILTRTLDEIQDKFRKTEKKLFDLETELEDLKVEKLNEARRYEHEVMGLKNRVEALKSIETNYSSLEKELFRTRKGMEKEVEDMRFQV